MKLLKLGLLGTLVLAASVAQPVAAQTALSGNMTVDNSFNAYLTTDLATLGTAIATGDDWNVTYPVAGTLSAGEMNYLVIDATDAGGPEMFVGDYAIDAPGAFRFANGTQALVTNTTDWSVGPTATDQSATVTSLGTNTNPNLTVWGYRAGISESAEFIWGDTPADNFVFVTAIEPLTDVAITAIRDLPDPVLAGSGDGNFTAEVDVTNVGVGVASGVEVTIGISGANDVTPVTVPPEFDGTVWTVGDLAVGETKTLTVTFTVGINQTTGDDVITWDAAVTAVDQTDLDSNNDSAQETTSVTAASDQAVGFATSIAFSNGFDGSVTATITCNAGLPLTNSFDISEGSPVTFSMTELPYTTPGTMCEIAIDGLESGYTAMGSANGGIAAASCMFDTSNFAVDGMNTCVFEAMPNATAVTVETIVDSDDPTIGNSFVTTISCDSVNPTTDANFIALTVTDDTGDFGASWYADPDGGTNCTVSTAFADSAIEAESCEFSFDVGDETAGCNVVGTVFFEGIPTLSQYGMAIMVLLMLGVGFVGMRRFV